MSKASIGIPVIVAVLLILQSCSTGSNVSYLSKGFDVCVRPTIKFSYKIRYGIDAADVRFHTVNGTFMGYIGGAPDTRGHTGVIPAKLPTRVTKIYTDYDSGSHTFAALYGYEVTRAGNRGKHYSYPLYVMFVKHGTAQNSPLTADMRKVGNALVRCRGR